jgi:small subunit ribosomal protein S20
MAHHKSAEKAIRQTKTRTERNITRRTRLKTAIKKVRAAVAAGDLPTSKTTYVAAQKELDKAANKGLIKKETAGRVKSRLNAAVKKVAGK